MKLAPHNAAIKTRQQSNREHKAARHATIVARGGGIPFEHTPRGKRWLEVSALVDKVFGTPAVT